jgi:hypothetical protein
VLLTEAAATLLPLWASIMIAVVPLAISALALIGGWIQQAATRKQQRDQMTANLDHDGEQQVRMLKHERERDDLSEVRKVLDEAARALHIANRGRRQVLGLGNSWAVEQFREGVRAAEEVGQRIAIRFGPEHPVTTAFSLCTIDMVDAFEAVDQQKEQQKVDEGTRQQLIATGRSWDKALPAFIDVAKTYAGVELPPRDTDTQLTRQLPLA